MNTNTAPTKRPTRTIVKFEDAGRVWIRVNMIFSDGTSDYIEEAICPVNKAHELFSEVEEEHFERLTRILKNRNKEKL